jgi:hypothetical protein
MPKIEKFDWFPYGKDIDDDADFSLEIAMSIDRVAPRAVAIMHESVALLSLVLWPTCDYPNAESDDWTATNPRIEIVAFGPECSVASHIKLCDWMRASFKDHHCGDDVEIEALENLKTVCDELIAIRQTRIEKRAKMERP